uniref:Uncharacterized protein n=1 Tax=Pavo cristatus TaxID=9049 RepID=A0A8C9FY11_PAVCR
MNRSIVVFYLFVASFEKVRLPVPEENKHSQRNEVGTIDMSAMFLAQVEGGDKDLHSGTFGGIIHEPLTDLIALLDSLVDPTGHIQIPGIYDAVTALTDEEKKLYESIEYDIEEHKNNSGVKKLLYSTKVNINAYTSHLYNLCSKLNECFLRLAVYKGSFKKMKDSRWKVFALQVVDHLENVFAKRNSPNKLKVSMPLGAQPWVADVNDPLYKAAKRAIKTVFGEDPDFIRDGSTIPIARIFQTITQKRVIMFPIGAADDGEHSQNEKISRSLSFVHFCYKRKQG